MRKSWVKIGFFTLLAGLTAVGTNFRGHAEGPYVPEWAKSVVWYEITPETFRNGDPSNDVTIEDQKKYFPDLLAGWRIHPWGSDWFGLADYERRNGKGLSYNIWHRRYGGDLQGVIDKLDYLHDLGIGAIYMMPIFYSLSYHKYDAVCYHHIDPNYGPDPVGDKALMEKEVPDDPTTWVWTKADRLAIKMIEEAHKRNIRIIFDGVFNHLGVDSFAFKDVREKGEKSRFKDWFTIYSWNDPQKKTVLKWKPFMTEYIYAELRKDQKAPNDYIFASTQRWTKPIIDGEVHEGVDGWRLDVADFIPHDFWRSWCAYVRSLNPEAYLMGECTKPFSPPEAYIKPDEFCSVMNYSFKTLLEKFFVNRSLKASYFDSQLARRRDALPGGVAYVIYNLLESHDTERMASLIVNPDAAKYGDARDFGSPELSGGTPDFNTRKPNAEEYNLLKLITIFQMTYVGAPAIYYGDEAGMWGACRNHKPMVWSDLNYENEVYVTDAANKPDGNKKAKDDQVEVNPDIFSHFQKMIRIRNAHPTLRLGDFKTLLADDGRELLVYSRNYQDETMVVIINNGDQPQIVELEGNVGYKDLLNDNADFQVKDGKVTVTVGRKWGAVLLKEK